MLVKIVEVSMEHKNSTSLNRVLDIFQRQCNRLVFRGYDSDKKNKEVYWERTIPKIPGKT